ncbi:hypothetical protein FACS1894198_2520 [Clostridia bacterium]|nr:hypothetical protein FACS1894198_2520 [Clostridia bacterium]
MCWKSHKALGAETDPVLWLCIAGCRQFFKNEEKAQKNISKVDFFDFCPRGALKETNQGGDLDFLSLGAFFERRDFPMHTEVKI